MPYQIKYSKTLLYAATDAIIDGKVVKSRNNIISPETEDEILTEIYKKIPLEKERLLRHLKDLRMLIWVSSSRKER